MRRENLVWMAVGLVFAATVPETTKAAAVPQLNGTSSNATTNWDDDDDYVPYQGDRYDVFDWNLCKGLAKRSAGNLLVSPISVKLALVLLFEGAQGETARELAAAMELPAGRAPTRDRFTTVLRSLKTPSPDYILDIGTRLYLDASIVPRQRYAAIVKTFYSTDLINANLSDTLTAANGINDWVSNITHGKVEKMISDDKSLKDSVLLVMNALYFMGTWKQPFPENATKMGKFYTSVDKSIEVPFMNTVGRFYHCVCPELDATLLRLPYLGHKYAMFLVLPNARAGLDRLAQEINPFIIRRQMWLMEDIQVDLSLPKFKFDFTSHLESVLREMGIRDIFDNTASMPGIARGKQDSRRLIVTDVVQKAGIDVDERGTTAHAVTEVIIGNKISDTPFHVTHPFMFFIEDETTGTVVFVGKVTNPLDTNAAIEAIDLPNPGTPNLAEGVTPPQVPTVSPVAASIEDRNNFFDIELLQTLNDEIEGNLIVAPASVKMALTILVEGSGGRTSNEITSLLRLPTDLRSLRAVARRSIMPFQNPGRGTEMEFGTRLWTGTDVEVSRQYIDNLQRYYGGNLQAVNFADASGSAKVINDWVRQETRGQINSIVDAGLINAGTRLLLTNVLYLKSSWLNAFDKESTAIRCFRVPNNRCQDSYLMESLLKYRYAYIPALDADVIELPYSNRKLSMLVFLPNRKDGGIDGLSRDLAHTPLSSIIASLRETEVLLSLPKFTIESKLDLRPALERLGIRDLFDLNANLSGIVNGPVRIGSVLHNAKIQVNEEGTIAAAVTGVAVVPLMGSTVQRFRADHPFIFILRDSEYGAVLFAGRITKPDPVNYLGNSANLEDVFGRPYSGRAAIPRVNRGTCD